MKMIRNEHDPYDAQHDPPVSHTHAQSPADAPPAQAQQADAEPRVPQKRARPKKRAVKRKLEQPRTPCGDKEDVVAQEPAPQTRLSLAEAFNRPSQVLAMPIRLYWAIATGFGVFVATVGIYVWVAALRMPTLSQSTLHDVANIDPIVQQRDSWLRDVLAARDEPSAWDHLLASDTDTPRPVQQRAKVKAAKKAVMREPATAPSAPELVDPVFAAYFGHADRYRAASRYPSAREGRVQPHAQAKQGRGRGVVFGARLQDDVSSDTAGAPVIASLLRAVDIDGVHLPAGSEVHGSLAGHNETRVFVAFQFLRLPDGSTFAFEGLARDASGRAGIAAQRRLTRRTAGSVGVASATRMVQQAGREFAGTVGNVLGAGIEGGATATADKSRRMDRDEYVLTAKAGTPIGIYVQDMHDGLNEVG